MYRRTGNRSNSYQSNVYQSGGLENSNRQKVEKLISKYGIDYSILEKSIAQTLEGATIYETKEGEQFIYCQLSGGEWYRDKDDPQRKRLVQIRTEKLEKDTNRYMMQPTLQKPETPTPNQPMPSAF